MKDSDEALKEEEASDVRMDREDVDDEDGENDKGSYPYSLK